MNEEIRKLKAELDELKKGQILMNKRFRDFELHNHGGIDSSFVDLSIIRKQTEFLIPASNSTMTGTVEVTADGVIAGVLSDAVTESVHIPWFHPPKKAVVSLELVWSSPAASGNGIFEIDLNSGGRDIGNIEPGQAIASLTLATLGAPAGVQKLNYFNFIDRWDGGVSFSVVRDNEIVGFDIIRTGGAAGDTLNALVNIYGILVTYA